MTKLLIHCTLLLTTLLFGLPASAAAADTTTADFRSIPLQHFQSKQISNLQGLDRNKPVYIKMWATWCQPCMQQMPHFQQLFQQFGDKINFVAVNIDINEAPAAVQQVIDKFGLTMPVWSDIEGKLAVQLGLIGTPFSVLLNSNGQQVYNTHESDQALDGLLARLAQGQQLPPTSTATLTSAQQQQLLKPFLSGEQYLFFSATWCDWYLKQSRPAMSLQCKQAQQQLDQLAEALPKTRWVAVVNHLWTDEKAVTEFRQLYKLQVPVHIDQNGVLFQHFNIRNIPLLIKVVDGKVVQQISDFSSVEQVLRQLNSAGKT